MKTRNLFFLCVIVLVACEKLPSECPPQWYFNIDKTKIPIEANPNDSIRVSFLEFLNDSTENTQAHLYYFEVPTIFKNPKGDIGYFVSQNQWFYYKLKDTLNPPRTITMEMKTINECTTNYYPKNFTLVYDTVP